MKPESKRKRELLPSSRVYNFPHFGQQKNTVL